MKKIIAASLGILMLMACSRDPDDLKNEAPEEFVLLSPAEGVETDVYDISFEWEETTDPDGDTVTYDLYLYNSGDSPTKIASDITTNTYILQGRYTFDASSTWYVVAKDGKKGETASPQRTFTTRSIQMERLLEDNAPVSFSPKRFSYTGVHFNDSFYIINGFGEQVLGDVWSSDDYGRQWDLETNLDNTGFERYAHSSVVFDDKIWVIGGYDTNPIGNIYSSTDGIDWSEEEFAGTFKRRYNHTSVLFKNKIWVIGGYDDTVFMDDVMSWTGRALEAWQLEADSARTPFDGIRGHSSVAFNDKIWVIGGEDRNEGFRNEVWSSTNGSDWIQDRNLPGVTAYHKSVVFDNKIWVIGGLTDSGPSNGIYYYDTDTGWNAYTIPVEDFAVRYNHAVIAVDRGTPDDGIYIVGSFNGSNYGNDVWKLY